MIPVVLATEPANFDRAVRQPGLDAIRELVGESPIAIRPGPKRKKIATVRAEIPSDKFPPFWRESLGDMLTAYHGVCAYACMYIERVTGDASVDHMLPKSEIWDQVYEWKNYRLACGLMNSRKNDARDVLDPFEIQDGWFALEFTGYQVVCGKGLDSSIESNVNETITRLKLNDMDCIKYREEYVEEYSKGNISLSYLERRSPFIARELRRQGLLRAGDR